MDFRTTSHAVASLGASIHAKFTHTWVSFPNPLQHVWHVTQRIYFLFTFIFYINFMLQLTFCRNVDKIFVFEDFGLTGPKPQHLLRFFIADLRVIVWFFEIEPLAYVWFVAWPVERFYVVFYQKIFINFCFKKWRHLLQL